MQCPSHLLPINPMITDGSYPVNKVCYSNQRGLYDILCGSIYSNCHLSDMIDIQYFSRNSRRKDPWDDAAGLKFDDWTNIVTNDMKIRIENLYEEIVEFKFSIKSDNHSFKICDINGNDLNGQVILLKQRHEFKNIILRDTGFYSKKSLFFIEIVFRINNYYFKKIAHIETRVRTPKIKQTLKPSVQNNLKIVFLESQGFPYWENEWIDIKD